MDASGPAPVWLRLQFPEPDRQDSKPLLSTSAPQPCPGAPKLSPDCSYWISPPKELSLLALCFFSSLFFALVEMAAFANEVYLKNESNKRLKQPYLNTLILSLFFRAA